MRIINVVLVTLLLLNGINMPGLAVNKNTKLNLKDPLVDSGVSYDALSSACDDYVPGEILVKMKAKASSGSSRLKKLLTYNLNSEDSVAVESYLEKNIAGLGDVSLDKAMKVPENQATTPLVNFSGAAKGRVVQVPAKTKLQIQAQNLQKEYGFDRIYKIRTREKECGSLERLVREIEKDSNVEYAEANRKLKANSISADDPLYLSHGELWKLPYDELWGLKQIQADKAWDISAGAGVVVAVTDSGVDYNHPDLWDNIWVDPNLVSDRNADGKINLDDADLDGNKTISTDEIIPGMFGYDFAYEDNDPNDVDGHGTHVAGTIAAVKNNAKGIIGIAPDAKILIVKIIGDDGSGSLDTIASGIRYSADLFANNPNIGSLVTNNSYGGAVPSQVISDAFEYAKKLGVISVVAAGNESEDAKHFNPSGLPSVITVAASRVDSGLSSFSNFGLRVDIAAPGGGYSAESDDDNILSTMNIKSGIATAVPGFVVQSDLNQLDYGYVRIAGTSMASPHIAGVVALIKSLHPEYKLEDIRSILRSTADTINSNLIETGIVNAFKAVSLVEVPPKAFLYPVSQKSLSGYISLKGTASSGNLQSYTLEYSADIKNPSWISMGSFNEAVEDALVLQDFNSSVFPEGEILIRLKVKDRSGKESEDIISVYIDNTRIMSPKFEDLSYYGYSDSGFFLPSFETTTVPNKFLPVTVDIFGAQSSIRVDIIDVSTGNLIEGDLLNYTGSTTGTVASIDTSKLPHPGLYKLKLSYGTKFKETSFIYEPKLSIAEPLRVLEKPWSLLSKYLRINDFNNDGVDEILLGEGKIKLFNSNSVLLEHSFGNGRESDIAPLVADLDGDGNKELISTIFDYKPFIAKISILAQDGKELTDWDQDLHELSFETMIGDVNLDNKPDVISLSGSHKAEQLSIYLNTMFMDSANLVHKDSYLLLNEGVQIADSIIGDFDHNGEEELAILIIDGKTSLNSIKIYSLKGVLIRTISTDTKYDTCALTAADIDQDQDLELIVSGLSSIDDKSGDRTSRVEMYNHDGSQVSGWPFLTEDGRWGDMSKVVVGDLNNDGSPEIIFGAWQSKSGDTPLHSDYIFALDTKGKLLPSYPVIRDIAKNRLTDFAALAPSSMIIADVDNDGKADIVAAMEPDKDQREVIFAYKDDGTLVKGFPLRAGNMAPGVNYYKTPSSMAVGNFDKDDKLELAFVDTLKYVYIYDLDTPATANIEWGMFRSDSRASGIYSKNLKLSPQADLSAKVLVDKSTVNTGDIITLELQAGNNLDQAKGWTAKAYGVLSSMDIPAGLTPVNINENCSIKDNKLTCNFYTILPGSVKRFYNQFKVENTQLKDIEILLGGATVSATSKVPVQISMDPNNANNISNTLKILVNQKRADLAITSFSTNKSTYLKGEEIVLTVDVKNNARVPASAAYGVLLKMPQPDFLVFDPVRQDPNQFCSSVNAEIVCQLFTMPVGGSKQSRIKFFTSTNSTVGTRTVPIGEASLTATSIVPDEITIDPVLTNNRFSTSISTVQYADLVANIKANKSSYRYNENINLTLSVQNKRDEAKSYIAAAYAVVTKMTIPSSYDYLGGNADCAIDTNSRILTCNFYRVNSANTKSQTITLTPIATKAPTRSSVINFSVSTSAQSTIPVQKTIDLVPSNDTKSLGLTVF